MKKGTEQGGVRRNFGCSVNRSLALQRFGQIRLNPAKSGLKKEKLFPSALPPHFLRVSPRRPIRHSFGGGGSIAKAEFRISPSCLGRRMIAPPQPPENQLPSCPVVPDRSRVECSTGSAPKPRSSAVKATGLWFAAIRVIRVKNLLLSFPPFPPVKIPLIRVYPWLRTCTASHRTAKLPA